MRGASFFIHHRVDVFKNISIKVSWLEFHFGKFFGFAGVIIEFCRSGGSLLVFNLDFVGSISERIVFHPLIKRVRIINYGIKSLVFFIFSCYNLLLCLGQSVNFIPQGVDLAFFYFLNRRKVIVLKLFMFTFDAIISQVWRLKNLNAWFINLVFMSWTYNNFWL